jgi:hypothetical protein
MTQNEINVTLFDEVKKLQNIKRKYEEDELRMPHEIDQLRGALLAMCDHYRQWSIPVSLYNQVQEVLSLSNDNYQSTNTDNNMV